MLSRKLFQSIIENVKKCYISNAVRYLQPIRDYDPFYLKITNSFYMRYNCNKYRDNYEKALDLEKQKNVHEIILDYTIQCVEKRLPRC